MANYNQLFYSTLVEKKHTNEFGKISERIDYSDFSNFVFYASAYYLINSKISEIIDTYPIDLSVTGGFNPNLIEKYNLWVETNGKLNEYIINQFPNKVILQDYDSTTGSYTNLNRTVNKQLKNQNDIDFISEYLDDAQQYDAGNYFKFQNLIPQHLILLDESETLQKFLHVLGLAMDRYIVSVNQFSNQFHTNYGSYNKFAKGSENSVAQLLGFSLVDGQFERTLSQYLLRDNFSNNLKTVTEQIWNRILNNLPYIYKSKGTLESIRAILNCYGITNNLLKLKEYGFTTKAIQIDINYDGMISNDEWVNGEYFDYDKIKIGTKSDSVINLTKFGISFDPIDEINKDIINSFTLSGMKLDISESIGYTDIFDKYQTFYPLLVEKAQSYFLNKSYDLNKFLRFIEDFDKGTIQTIKQLIPARTKLITEGVNITHHLFEKNKLTDNDYLDYDLLEKNECIAETLDIETSRIDQTVFSSNSINLNVNNLLKGTTSNNIASVTSNKISSSSQINFSVNQNLFDLDENVIGTNELIENRINNLTNNIQSTYHNYVYQDKYYIENRLLKIDSVSGLDLNLIGTLTYTTLATTGATTASNFSISYTVKNKPFVFGKVKVIVPLSSSGLRLLEIKKQTSWVDYMQSLDCNNQSISSNTKLNIFEFYSDTNGKIELTLINNLIRTGTVPIIIQDENNLKPVQIDISLSGTGSEVGVYGN